MTAIPKKDFYTYEDWESWDEDFRAELIDGKLYLMASPSQRHQEIVAEICRQIGNHLLGKQCKVLPAPFGVRLEETKDTVVEPDIVVVCDPSKLDGKICKGAPDMVVEVVSPSSIHNDTIVKFQKYLRAGVTEYWIVDPVSQLVKVHTMSDGSSCSTVIYTANSTIKIGVLENCTIDLQYVFPEDTDIG